MPDVLDLPLRTLLTGTRPANVAGAFAADRPHGGVEEDARGGPPLDPEGDHEAAPTDAPEELLRGAVFALAARELAALVRSLPPQRMAAVLRERDPAAAVGELLADAALAHTAATTDDPLAVALLQGARRKRELLAGAGGAWPTGMVAEHLGITRQGVDKRRQAGTLLGVRLPGGDWVYPALQFGPDGAPLAGLAEALGVFRGLESPWMQLENLLALDSALASADGAPRSALRALRDDGPAALPAVIAALRQTADPDA